MSPPPSPPAHLSKGFSNLVTMDPLSFYCYFGIGLIGGHIVVAYCYYPLYFLHDIYESSVKSISTFTLSCMSLGGEMTSSAFLIRATPWKSSLRDMKLF